MSISPISRYLFCNLLYRHDKKPAAYTINKLLCVFEYSVWFLNDYMLLCSQFCIKIMSFWRDYVIFKPTVVLNVLYLTCLLLCTLILYVIHYVSVLLLGDLSRQQQRQCQTYITQKTTKKDDSRERFCSVRKSWSLLVSSFFIRSCRTEFINIKQVGVFSLNFRLIYLSVH